MRLCLAVCALLAAAQCQKLFSGDQVLRINAESEEHIQLLKELENDEGWELDFWTHPVSADLSVDIRVPFASLQAVKRFLHAHQISFSVMINSLQELLDAEQEGMKVNAMQERNAKSFNFGAYHTLDTVGTSISYTHIYNTEQNRSILVLEICHPAEYGSNTNPAHLIQIYSWMDTLVAAHPNLVSKVQIGSSYENRPMYVLKFSTGGNQRPAVWVDAGIHSREWVSSASAVWMANKMATDYGVDPSVTSLLGQMDVYLMVVTNPDGYVYTHTSDRMWRKTRSKNPGSVCRGVDPNRNWDAGFGGPGASKNPCSESYHGPSAHSEIEVKNVVSLIKNHGNFKAFISIHAYSQLLMYPYGYKCTSIPDQAELDTLGQSAVQALSSLYGTSYKVGSICKIIYQASGGSIDWSYDIGIKYSFAFELRDTGRYGFILPANQIIPTASETWLGLKYIMEHVRDNSY